MQMLSRQRSPALAIALTLALIGCAGDDTALTKPLIDVDDVRAFVTGDAAASLDASGRFRLAPPESLPHPQLSAESAFAIARATLEAFGPTNLPYLEHTHGADIDLRSVTPSTRVYYARTPYQPQDHGIHPTALRRSGPFFFVTFTSADDTPVISQAVPAYATDVTLNDDGSLTPESTMGAFFMTGISPEMRSLPMSPEAAVSIVASSLGARVQSVPELVMPGFDYAPQWARWRISLEGPVSLRGSKGGVRQTQEVYVGPGGTLWIPERDQPATRAVEVGEGRTTHLTRRPDIPVAFERVTPLNARGES